MDVKVFRTIEQRGHEQVAFFHYPQAGLKAIIGIHNTALGPALGGCRMRSYQDESEAIDDVLRLSEGMTYKSAMAGLALGGGKACIIANPEMREGRRELFEQFAHCLNHLAGRYITAEDMGTSEKDVTIMRTITKYAAGRPREAGGSGDPSPWTAKGVFYGIQAACERRYGSHDLRGKKVAVQGVGHVGLYLLELLANAGVKLIVTDTRQSALDEAHRRFGAEVVATDAIYDVDCDIYSPCAVGQTVNPGTLLRLKCDIIAGGANNQLLDSSVYKTMNEKNILYCPDFIINAGGVISVAAEYNENGWQESWVRDKVEQIGSTTRLVLDESVKRKQFPEVVAIELAKEKVKAAGGKK